MSDVRSPQESGYKISSLSGGGNCVEVRQAPGSGSVAVRNSRHRDQATLTFSDQEWASFVLGVKAGEFDPA